jgi:RsiW-degrading membrane proteinase PrsW (M82 family)
VTPLSLAVAFLPVLAFLAVLLALDSYKLVTGRHLAASIVWGGIAAALCFAVNRSLLESMQMDAGTLRRYIAPALEEIVKAAWVLHLIRRARLGFLVDAAVHGFAAGTGFALVENAWYAHALGDAGPFVWLIRGLGTAIMHGSLTATSAMVTKALSDRRHASARVHTLIVSALPGLAMAIFGHSVYNHLVLPPLVMTTILLVVAPIGLYVAFAISERATRDWLGHGLDRDAELLELIDSGAITSTPAGEYLSTLRARFPGEAVADMLCMLQLRLELAMRAKGLLLARAAGIDVPVDREVVSRLDELHFLERSIGATGRLAMRPLIPEGRDRWQIDLLEARR